jgi:small subunit ribosomal protein S13
LSEFRHIVRIKGKDLDGSKKLVAALADLKGVGLNLAYAIINALRLDPKARLGSLSEAEINEIEKGLSDPSRIGIPAWKLNRRKDPTDGLNYHLIGADLEFAVRSDIEREKMIGSWRGVRHSLGLKVRGQRTRTTGRKGRTVGVRKSAA